jgi:hypothetical protein
MANTSVCLQDSATDISLGAIFDRRRIARGVDRMWFRRVSRVDQVRAALTVLGLVTVLTSGVAAAAPTFIVGTYAGTTSQGQHFTFFVTLSACTKSSGPTHACLYASGPNNVELIVGTKCAGESAGGSFGVDLGPTVIPSNGVVNQRQGLSPGTFTSHIVLTTHRTATGFFIAQANGCTSGRVTFTARRTGPIKY